MTPKDFKKIDNFDQEEIENTGANIKDVQLELLLRYDNYRKLLGRRVYFLRNGLTTGSHDSETHYLGLAGDSCLDPRDGPIDGNLYFKCPVEVGYKGYGQYYNGFENSFHLDCRQNYGFWTGVPDGKGNWKFGSLIVDPKNLI